MSTPKPFNLRGTPKRPIPILAAAIVFLFCVTVLAVGTRSLFGPLSGNRLSAPRPSTAPGPQPARSDVGYVSRGTVWPSLRRALRATGDRMERPGKERVTMVGTLNRGDSAPASLEVVREFPDRLRTAEQAGLGGPRVTVFDGRATGGRSYGAREADDIETLLFDTVEHFFAARTRGAAVSFLGSNFRLDDGSAPDYAGPFYDVYQVFERIGIGRDARARAKLYYFNSRTSLLERVRYDAERGGSAVGVEVLLGDWRVVAGQTLPGRVERREGGERVFTFQAAAVVIGPRVEGGLLTAAH